MARASKPTDFVLTVDGVGTFTFARKTMRDEFSVQAEYMRLTEGISPVPMFLDTMASAVATLKVLTVKSPDGWNIDEMDAEDEVSYEKIMNVWGALRDKMNSFRRANKVGEEKGEGGV
jgi:hypothetical protein